MGEGEYTACMDLARFYLRVRDGRVVDRASWFIRPPFGHDVFQEWNVRIHGIRPEDVAGAVYLLCLPEAAMITGHTLIVDGGFAISG